MWLSSFVICLNFCHQLTHSQLNFWLSYYFCDWFIRLNRCCSQIFRWLLNKFNVLLSEIDKMSLKLNRFLDFVRVKWWENLIRTVYYYKKLAKIYFSLNPPNIPTMKILKNHQKVNSKNFVNQSHSRNCAQSANLCYV